MGRMSDLHIDMQNDRADLEYYWYQMIGHILDGKYNTKITSSSPPNLYDHEEYEISRIAPDFTYDDSKKGKTAVELKVYRWRNDWLIHATKAITHLKDIMNGNRIEHGVLIVTWALTHKNKEKLAALMQSANVDIWDLGDLRAFVSGDARIGEQLEELINDTIIYDDNYGELLEPSKPVPKPSDEKSNPGHDFSLKLKNSVAGKRGWRDFEVLCEKSFRLLFRNDIVEWRTQNRTDDGLNKMDLIGRINTGPSSFWSGIERDFQTRYVVFEAKNYKKKIKQGEVYTTEKYLFTTALRSVAIIIARNGFDDGAQQAAIGALREQGKLILIFTMHELCLMLEHFDQGDVPENVLYKKMDDLLMCVGR